MERKNRGASAMDGYESGASSYDSGKIKKLPCCSRIARNFILWVNIGSGILAIIIISIGIYSYTAGHITYIGEVDAALFALSLILGLLIMFLSILGCMTAKTKNMCMVYVYMLGLFVSLIFEIVIAALVLNPQTLKGLMRKRWNNLTSSQQIEFEDQFGCCGFDGLSSTSSGSGSGYHNTTLTTAMASSCPGCYSRIERSIHSAQVALGAIAVLLIFYELLMFAVCMLIFWANKKNCQRRST